MRQTFFFFAFQLINFISLHFLFLYFKTNGQQEVLSKLTISIPIFHSIPISHFPLNCSSRGHSGSPDQDSLPLVQQRLPRIHSHVPGRAHRCGTYPQLSWGWKLPFGGVFADLETLAPASWEVALETGFSRPRKKYHKDLTTVGSSGLLTTLNARPGRLTGLPGLGVARDGQALAAHQRGGVMIAQLEAFPGDCDPPKQVRHYTSESTIGVG